MKRHQQIIIACALIFLAGCTSPHILITSNKYHFPLTHSKIMAVGVIKSNTDSVRIRIERNLVADLNNMGYNSVSALEEFGAKGLANLGQEETYLKLCNEGIDAVIIVTLIDKDKEQRFKTHKSYAYPDNYYFTRIWNYEDIQADLSVKDSTSKSDYFWEAILFNLSTLEAECTVQSRSFQSPDDNKAGEFEKQLVKKMTKEKILKRQDTKRRKAF